MSNEPIRLTISQAGNLFGVSEKTIRRAIQNQEVNYIVVRGIYKINFESLLIWSQNSVKLRNKMEKQGIGQYVSKWKINNVINNPEETIPEKPEIKEVIGKPRKFPKKPTKSKEKVEKIEEITEKPETFELNEPKSEFDFEL